MRPNMWQGGHISVRVSSAGRVTRGPGIEPSAAGGTLLRVTTALVYTQRVEIGAWYTDGDRVAEVVDVSPFGHVKLCDVRTEEPFGLTITPFRQAWWRVK